MMVQANIPSRIARRVGCYSGFSSASICDICGQKGRFDQGIYGHLTIRNLAVLAEERGDLAGPWNTGVASWPNVPATSKAWQSWNGLASERYHGQSDGSYEPQALARIPPAIP